MSKGYSIRVRIGGRTFSIISDEKPEYLTQVAAAVDRSISGMLSSNPNLTFERAAVLSALKFCDDSQKNTESVPVKKDSAEDDRLRQQVVEYSKELEKATQKQKQLEKEIKELKTLHETKMAEVKKAYDAREIQFREYINKIKNQ
ncbi:MAG: cell division protein ZapA [Clostridia bacterium]|nr:cell division protein ZapA [Clostridia bacterium]